MAAVGDLCHPTTESEGLALQGTGFLLHRFQAGPGGSWILRLYPQVRSPRVISASWVVRASESYAM